MYSAGLIPARCAFRQIFARTSAGRLSVGRIVSWIVRSGDMAVDLQSTHSQYAVCKLKTRENFAICIIPP
jgi:hypothetical protein